MNHKNFFTASGILFAVLCIILTVVAVYLNKEPLKPDITMSQVITSASETFTETDKYISPIDFESIQKDASDVIAWLSIDGTDISYPVVFREGDNSYYLRRNIYGKYDRNGSLFIEDYNKADFSDPVSIIYGHHMSSGAMFGKLQEIYTNPKTFSEHSDITLFLPEKELKYRVFCAVPLDNSHILYYHNFSNATVYENYFKEVFETRSLMAVFDENISVKYGQQVLMLSTCFSSDYSRRYVVMAVCENQ